MSREISQCLLGSLPLPISVTEAKEKAQKKEIVDLKKLVKSSQKRPAVGSGKGAAAGSGKGPASKKSRKDKTLTFIVCSDGVYS